MRRNSDKTLYESINHAIDASLHEVMLSSQYDKEEVEMAFREVLRDNPQYFWFLSYRFENVAGRICLSYSFSQSSVDNLKRQIVSTISKEFGLEYVKTLPVLSKVLYVFKWLLHNTRYDERAPFSQTIEGVFVYHRAGSIGYSKAAQFLFQLLGIKSRLEFGRLKNNPSIRLCWNLVCLEGKWYHLDVCMGDIALAKRICPFPSGISKVIDGINFSTFCVPTEWIQMSRTIEEFEDLPSCTDYVDLASLPTIWLKSRRYGISAMPNASFRPRINPDIKSASPSNAAMAGIVGLNESKVSISSGWSSSDDSFMEIEGLDEEISDMEIEGLDEEISEGAQADTAFVPTSPSDEGLMETEEEDSVLSIKRKRESYGPKSEHIGQEIEFQNLGALPSAVSPAIFSAPLLILGGIASYFFKRRKKEKGIDTKSSPVSTPQYDDVNACVYAPTEVRRDDNMLVQVFIYRDKEAESVKIKAQTVDSSAQLRQYCPLEMPLRIGDKIRLRLKMKGVEIDNDTKCFVWQGKRIDRQFSVYIPKRYAQSALLGLVEVYVNELPVGEMAFKTSISEAPDRLWTEVQCRRYEKIFVSYSHKDFETVRPIIEGLRITNSEYFFDRHSLKGGDNFPEKIRQWIETSDVFALCWSQNAAASEWVEKEKRIALNIVSKADSRLRIYPVNIRPEAPLPADMRETFTFAQLNP